MAKPSRAHALSRYLFGFGFASLMMSAGSAGAENLVGDSVVLRTLDKVTATTQDYTVKVGESLTYGALTVDVKHCEKKPPEDVPETFAFVQIYDGRLDGTGQETEPERLFSGWMLASKPAISALDHPVYDVWILDCKLPDEAVTATEFRERLGLDPSGTLPPGQ